MLIVSAPLGTRKNSHILKETYYAHFQNHTYVFLDSTRLALHESHFKIIPNFFIPLSTSTGQSNKKKLFLFHSKHALFSDWVTLTNRGFDEKVSGAAVLDF